MTDDRFTAADHARAQQSGQRAMAGEQPRRQHAGWRFTFGWLALTQLIAAVVAVVNLFHPVDLNRAVVGYLISWPVVVSPQWLGLVLAVLALLVMATAWVRLGGGQGRQRQ